MPHALAMDCHTIYVTCIDTSRVLNLRTLPSMFRGRLELSNTSRKLNSFVVCGARGPRPRQPRVWKTRNKIGTISKSQKLVQCIKELSNVKEEVYGALDSFIAWELEFPLIVVKKALKTLESEKEWKRIIQVTKWMLSKGQGKTMGSYYTLINAFAEDGRLEEAEELWTKIFSANLESLPRTFFIKMISIYYNNGMHEKMFEIFADMEELSIRPDGSIVKMVGDVFQKLGMLDHYKRLMNKYPPLSWEYRYYKGKRVRVRSKQPNKPLNDHIKQTNEPEEEACVTQPTESEDKACVTQPNELLNDHIKQTNEPEAEACVTQPNESEDKACVTQPNDQLNDHIKQINESEEEACVRQQIESEDKASELEDLELSR